MEVGPLARMRERPVRVAAIRTLDDRRETEAAVRPSLGEAAWQAARLEADRLTPEQLIG